MAFVLPCAVLVALARTSGIKTRERIMTVYVAVIRAIPVLLIIFWVYLAVRLI
jgi:polar amino acid transport system permease protein